jgi:DNA-binding NarL/FixJ family response regulator
LADYGGIEVVGQTNNDEGAVELVRLTKPDVILMQVQMPIPRARENFLRMREVSDPAPKVVIVTMIEDPRQVRELMELGASAYIVKSASTEHLIAAVRAAIVDPKSNKNVVVGMPRALLEEAEEGSDGVLSARELEILLLASRGLSTARSPQGCTSQKGPSSATWPTPTTRWGWAPGARPPGKRSTRSGSPSRTSPTTSKDP